MQIWVVTDLIPHLTLALCKWRHVFPDGVFYPIMEGGDTCVDAWKSFPCAAVTGRDNSCQNPLVIIPAYHGTRPSHTEIINKHCQKSFMSLLENLVGVLSFLVMCELSVYATTGTQPPHTCISSTPRLSHLEGISSYLFVHHPTVQTPHTHPLTFQVCQPPPPMTQLCIHYSHPLTWQASRPPSL